MFLKIPIFVVLWIENMRYFITLLMATLLATVTMAGAPKSPQEKYIEKYAPTAVREMYRSGVPASITLAQGLLESSCGESRLATKGNNHFGIKCHNTWKGARMYQDDDARGECFRVYKTADESFVDHSDFLRYRDRYKFLFDLRTTDYKGWAYGLKKAGYATDPAYPKKLIKLIEDYKLYEYDKKKRSWAGDVVPDVQEEEKVVKKKQKGKHHRKPSGKHSKETESDQAIPESPLQMEQAQPVTKEKVEVLRFNLSRETFSLNGVPFVYSVEGETYESIAKQYNLFPREVLKINDLSESQPLAPGTVVYLQAKKKQTARGLDKYVCEGGENLRDISQRFAVSLKSIRKLNNIQGNPILREGDVIKLRK